MITAQAPGKIFLLGEYAVLAGFGGLVAAVDKHVVVRFSPQAGQPLRVRGSLIEARLSAEEAFSDAALDGPAARVVAGLRAAYDGRKEKFFGGELEVDSHALYAGGRKLGFGSSAAVVVAVYAAIKRALDERVDAHAAFLPCKRWHNRAQKTEGSGGDIAASLLGAMAWLEHDRIEAVPARVPLAVLQHPEAASTPRLVGKAAAFAERDRTRYDVHMQTLGALAIEGKKSLLAHRLAAFCAVVRSANTALAAFGNEANITIATDAHMQAAATCESLGGACKPAGAGGGDISLVTAPDDVTLDRIIAALGDNCRRVQLAEHGVVC